MQAVNVIMIKIVVIVTKFTSSSDAKCSLVHATNLLENYALSSGMRSRLRSQIAIYNVADPTEKVKSRQYQQLISLSDLTVDGASVYSHWCARLVPSHNYCMLA